MISPEFKIYNPSDEYVGCCKYLEDAAAFVSLLGCGAQIRSGHRTILWREGKHGYAGESYDECAAFCRKQITEKHEASMKRRAAAARKAEQRAGGAA